VTVAILLVMPTALVGVYYDDGIYLALAKSLAEGHGYHLQYLPGTPGAVHYPFGYPLFLAFLWKLWPSFPANVALLRGANAVLMGVFAALAVAYLTPRLRLNRWITAAVVLASCTAIPLVAVTTVLFAEPLFLVLTAAALWTADAALALANDSDRRRSLRLAIAAGVLAGGAAMTRSIGVAVIAGVAIPLLRGRHWRLAAAAGTPAVLLLLPWVLWTGAHHGDLDPLLVSGYGTYGDFLKQGGTSWLSLASLGEVARPLAAIGLPPGPAVLRVILGITALVVLLAGMAALTSRAPALGWMLGVYALIVALWPYGPDRFLWGVLPWLAAAFVAGAHLLASRPAGAPYVRATTATAAIASAAVLLGFALFQVRLGPRGATSEQVAISATMNDILPWIRQSTDTTSIIAGEDEALIWLYTGRKAVPSYLWRVRGRAAESFGPDSLRAFLLRSGATHMILTGPNSDAAPTIDALLAQRRGFLEMVRMWPGQLMAFRLHPGA
jgi:hypothetical protein